jgi:PIN domain nuclease of toxin-antitoxin system
VKFLLDTHVWIWAVSHPGKISGPAQKKLKDSSNELWLSPISVWEALLLIEKGRIRVKGQAHTWVEQALKSGPIKEAALTTEIALLSRAIDLPHPDPADRFIAATARHLGLTLMTADERLLDCDGLKVFPA